MEIKISIAYRPKSQQELIDTLKRMDNRGMMWASGTPFTNTIRDGDALDEIKTVYIYFTYKDGSLKRSCKHGSSTRLPDGGTYHIVSETDQVEQIIKDIHKIYCMDTYDYRVIEKRLQEYDSKLSNM